MKITLQTLKDLWRRVTGQPRIREITPKDLIHEDAYAKTRKMEQEARDKGMRYCKLCERVSGMDYNEHDVLWGSGMFSRIRRRISLRKVTQGRDHAYICNERDQCQRTRQKRGLL